MRVIVLGVQAISAFHGFLGLLSVCVGVVSSIQAEVWLAHSVSPIWSGGFFLITGILGVLCSKRKTAYLIMCFTAFSVVSLVTAVVSIQLLRLGLVNHTTDGHTFQKEDKDVLIIIALVAAGSECLVCLVSAVFSCRMAKAVKKELFKQREGMFHVKGDGGDQNFTAESSLAFDNISMEGQPQDIAGQDCYQSDQSNEISSPHNQTPDNWTAKESEGNNNPGYNGEENTNDTERSESLPSGFMSPHDNISDQESDTSLQIEDIKVGVKNSKNLETHQITQPTKLIREPSTTSVDVPEVDT